MENAVVTSVIRDAAVARTRKRGAWKAASTFGLGLIGTGMAILLVAIIFSGADPGGLTFVIPMLLVAGGVAYLVATRGRWAQGVAVAVALLFGGMVTPVIPHAAFDSVFDFFSVALVVTGAPVVIVAGALDLARREPSEQTPRLLVGGAVTIVSVLAFAGLASAIATYAGQDTLSAAERDGRLPVDIRDSAFKPKNITVTEGEEVRLALKNSDLVIHDLHMPELDLKFTVKPGSEKAFEFIAPEPGHYAFDCSLHTNMKGVLEVVAK